jgi:hypothetical protein
MSTPTAYSTTDADTTWLDNLTRTAPGRQLGDHLRCVDFVIQNKNRTECPVQQVGDFRRVFCRSIAEHDRSFGLPRPLPKFIAIVNLSGFRGIMYSSRNALIRLLCLVGPDSSERVMRNVEQVLRYAEQHSCSVLCCFSLPWQAGVHQVHWEVRTLEMRADGAIRDGAMCYSYTSEEVRVCATTAETDFADPAQMKASMDAMRLHFSACNLDTMEVADGDSQESMDDSEKMHKLKGIIAVVRTDRERIIGELSAVQEDQKAKLQEAYRLADERVAVIVSKTQISLGVAEKKILELNTKVTTLTEENSRLVKDKAEADSRRNEQDLLFGNERTTLKTKANLQGLSAKSATDKLTELQKSSTREREAMEKAHAKQVEDIERRLSDKTVESRKLQLQIDQGAAVAVRMDELLEQMRTEKQALQFETINRRKKVIGLQCALAVACNEHSKCMAAAAIDQEGMTTGQHELQQMLAMAEGAAHSSEESVALLSSEMDKLKKELEAERKKKRPKTPSPPPKPPTPPPLRVYERSMEPAEFKPSVGENRAIDETVVTEPASWLCERAMVDAEGQTAPIKSKVDQELEDLSERFVRLGDEKAALEQQVLELTRQLQDVAMVPSPTGSAPSAAGDTTFKQQVYNQVYNQVVVPGAQGWQQPAMGPMDLGSDPNGDPGFEALVGQMQHSLRSLVEIGRQGLANKHLADNMWSELQAMKRFTGGDGNGQWQPAGYFGEMVPMGTMAPPWAVPHQPYVAPAVSNGHGGHLTGNGHSSRPKKGGR